MNRFRKIAIIIVLMLVVSFVFWRIRKNETDSGSTLTVGNHTFLVEIADTDELREKGLSRRESLGENEGMLFIFPTKSLPGFWMKNMNFPLDFLWISDDKIVDITENVQPSDGGGTSNVPAESDGGADANLKSYFPEKPVNMVLEINGGLVQKLGIREGDTVIIKNSKK